MAGASGAGGHAEGFAATSRRDAWWVGPLLTVLGLTTWGVYYLWVALTAKDYAVGPYLSPFFSPLVFSFPGASETVAHHAWLGEWSGAWPSFLPRSPALFIFLFPASFRATCYYYRKAYYRAFFGTPPGCAVGPVPQGRFKGETGLLVVQNLHRYTVYFALLLLPFLFYDSFAAFFYQGRFGVGVGSVVVTMNAVLLSAYTLGCHAWRHLIGGRLNCFSCDGGSRLAFSLWKPTTWLNGRHMQFAWASLFWIAFADLYVRLVATGVIKDLNTWGDF